MIRNFLRAGLLAASLAGLAVYAAQTPQQQQQPPSQTQRQSPSASSQTASGKIGAVASDGFTLEVNQGSSTQTLRFVTDSNTKVKGKLEAGATAAVEYTTDGNGRNVAQTIVVESNG